MRLLTGADFWSLHGAPAVGLRRIVVSDGPAGVRGRDVGRAHAVGERAGADRAGRDLGRARGSSGSARLLAFEARRKGVDVLLAPTVNLHRTPLRRAATSSASSEDPYADGADRRRVRARAAGRGRRRDGQALRGQRLGDRALHAWTRGSSTSGRCASSTCAPFELIMAARPWAVMAAYNAVNGVDDDRVAAAARGRCKDEWGWDGRRDVRLGRHPQRRRGGGPRDARPGEPARRRADVDVPRRAALG